MRKQNLKRNPFLFLFCVSMVLISIGELRAQLRSSRSFNLPVPVTRLPYIPTLPGKISPEEFKNIFRYLGGFTNGYTSTHGGKFETDEENTWFLGEKPIEYCIYVGRSYPFSQIKLSELISSSLNQWQEFFQKYGMSEKVLSGFSDGKERKMSLNFKKVEKCQSPKDQLIFLFGKVSKEEIMAKNYPNHLGLATRGKYNHQIYRTGGIVWVNKFTDEAQKLKHLILHELGHVFGMKHDSVFVMDGKIAETLTNRVDPYFGKIESPHWKYKLKKNSFNFTYNEICDEEKGFIRNDSLPRELLKLGEFDRNGCYQLSVNNKRSMGRTQLLDLSIKTLTGKSIQLSGKFKFAHHTLAANHMGPGVYTGWKVGTGMKKGQRKVFDPDLSSNLLQGTFKGEGPFGEIKLGASLTLSRGPVLTLYFAETGKWWNGLFPNGFVSH